MVKCGETKISPAEHTCVISYYCPWGSAKSTETCTVLLVVVSKVAPVKCDANLYEQNAVQSTHERAAA